MKVGDMVRLKTQGIPNIDNSIGIVMEVIPPNEKLRWLDGGIVAYWGEGHHMNGRRCSTMGLEVLNGPS